MAANTNPPFVIAPNSVGATFVNADGTAKKTIFTAGTNGSRLFAINIVSDDTSARDVDVYLNDGSTDYRLGTAAIGIGAGTSSGSSSVNLLTTAKIPGLASDGSWFLKNGWIVKLAMQVAVTSAKTVTALSHGGDY